MQKPAIPIDEDERLNTLNSLGLLDTPPDTHFDRFTHIAQRLFAVPIALISLVDYDRQWFKSCRGLSVAETSRDISFCGHAIHESEPLIIEDTLQDPRFVDNPLVSAEPHIRFYAGYSLSAPNGKKIGTLCIIDHQPRCFSHDDIELLKELGKLLENEIRVKNDLVIDQLTGLYNKHGFMNIAERQLAEHLTQENPFAIVYLDVNDIHALNAQYGHSVGDKALLEFSELLLQTFYGAPAIARLDNDNFAVLVNYVMLQKVYQPMQQLIEAISIRNKFLQRGYTLAFSMGISKFDPVKHRTIDDILVAAHNAMLENKKTKTL